MRTKELRLIEYLLCATGGYYSPHLMDGETSFRFRKVEYLVYGFLRTHI